MQTAITFDSKYDFARFDTSMKSEPKTKKKAKAEVKVKEEAPAKSKPIISGFALVAWIVCMALFFGIIYSYMRLNEVSAHVSNLQNEIQTIREENQMLEIEKEQMYGSQRLQEIAVNQLGMQKIQKSQITYVNTNAGDYTEIAQSRTMKNGDSTLIAGIARGFNLFIEYIN
ncbi:MAG: cell division protein FtsL [Clostridia bacterium]|nr:cell division protein FtsL [Clostridia bacterium]